MFQQKSVRVEDKKQVVHFSDNQTYYFNGILFKLFRTGSKNPKAPELALLKVDTQDRISGLFKIGSNLYQGDTKSTNGKHYFRIRFIGKNSIELTNFEIALIEGGYITPEIEITPFLEDYSTSQDTIKGSTGIQNCLEVGLWVRGETGQLNMTS